jgi:hypothetical protein
MNQQSKSQPKIDLKALGKERRAVTTKENIRISKELGITPESVLSEIKREMESVLRQIRSPGEKPERRKQLFDYESCLYALIDHIEDNWYDSLTIQNRFKEIKKQYEDMIKPKQ